MNPVRLLARALEMASWFMAVVLIGLTSSAVRQSSGDAIYVLNTVFLLFGGVAFGRVVSGWLESRLSGARQ